MNLGPTSSVIRYHHDPHGGWLRTARHWLTGAITRNLALLYLSAAAILAMFGGFDRLPGLRPPEPIVCRAVLRFWWLFARLVASGFPPFLWAIWCCLWRPFASACVLLCFCCDRLCCPRRFAAAALLPPSLLRFRLLPPASSCGRTKIPLLALPYRTSVHLAAPPPRPYILLSLVYSDLATSDDGRPLHVAPRPIDSI